MVEDIRSDDKSMAKKIRWEEAYFKDKTFCKNMLPTAYWELDEMINIELISVLSREIVSGTCLAYSPNTFSKAKIH